MTLPLTEATPEEALFGLAQGTHQAMQDCVRVFTPLLFTLAERAQVTDWEAAVVGVFRELERHHQGWPRSGLPARVWVTGMAQRHFRAGPTPHHGLTAPTPGGGLADQVR